MDLETYRRGYLNNMDAKEQQRLDDEHTRMVESLVKPGQEILDSLTPEKCNLLHAILGMMSELGELADCIKKHVIYEQTLDMENMKEEGGDLEFYFKQLRLEIRCSRIEMMASNMAKLAKRYPNFKYTNAKAKERIDKQNEK